MDERMRATRVVLVTNIPNPYRLALFTELNRRMEGEGMSLRVVFGSPGYRRRKFILDWSTAGFNYTVLKSLRVNAGGREKTMITYSGLSRLLRKEQPDVVVVGGFSLATFRLWCRSFFRKTRYIIWSGSVTFPGWYDSAARRFLRRLFVRRAAAYVAYGSRAAEYLVALGAPRSSVHIAMNTVDTEFFAAETRKKRKELTPPEKRHLLFVGYLEPRKDVGALIELAGQLAKERTDFVLDIVGDGTQRQRLMQDAVTRGIADHVVFHGFVQKNDLPAYFARASCFLFQTGFDIWGLVLNEAMAAGLPCIVSDKAGAAYDLIRHGETGYRVDFHDTGTVCRLVNDVLDHPQQAAALGEAAAAYVRQVAGLPVSAQGFIGAVQDVLRK
jgi:glycosyltransferase involved in cell wall biosynthesis